MGDWYSPFWDPGTSKRSWVQIQWCAAETPAGLPMREGPKSRHKEENMTESSTQTPQSQARSMSDKETGKTLI
jgi:hypothetical protein